jgi:hypothetical protein
MFTAINNTIARIRAFFRTHDLDRDFKQELDSHVAMLTEDNLQRGMTHDEARRAALIRVGAGASIQDQHREARGLPAFETGRLRSSRLVASYAQHRRAKRSPVGTTLANGLDGLTRSDRRERTYFVYRGNTHNCTPRRRS